VVCSASGRRCRGRVSGDGGADGRDAGSQLGAMRPQLVAQCVDQRVPSATAAANVVDTPDGVCAGIRTAVDSTTSSTAAVGAAAPSGMGWGSSAVGLDWNLTAPSDSQLPGESGRLASSTARSGLP
jgi:hypothetical protein